MDIAQLPGIELMTLEAELRASTHKQIRPGGGMVCMTGGTIPLLSGLMRASCLPEAINIGVAPEAQLGFLTSQISGDITAVGLMTRAAALLGEGLVLMCFCAGALPGVTGVAHLAFGLIEKERMLTGVGLMAVAAAPLFEGDMAETGLELGGAVFVTFQAALGLRLLQQGGML
jgi:hypothetical protein